MNFTFQFKLLVAIVSFIAVLLFILQATLMDKTASSSKSFRTMILN